MARSLAFKNVQKALRAAQGEAEIESDLPPGHMRLWSNFKPNLRAGHYGIEVKQSIKSPNGNEALDVFNYDPAAAQTILPQRFDVVAPQFSLDPKVINSYYPPDGHQDEGRVLPHIVFNDPHIPWDRVQTVGRDFQVAGPLISERVAIPPWIALAVFDPSELTLDAADGLALNISGFNEASLPSSGAYSMPVGQYISNIKSRITYEQSLVSGIITQDDWNQLGASTEPTTVIFPTKARAKEIFSPAVKFALMSHVREVSR